MDQHIQTAATPHASSYVDQSAQMLGLAFFDRTVDCREFSVFAQRNCRLGEIFVRLTVIGASHLVNVGWQKHEFSELLSCVSRAYQDPILALPAGVAGEEEARCDDPLFDYRFRLKFETLAPDTRALPARLIPRCSEMAWASFPSLPGSPKAVTMIGATVHPQGINAGFQSREKTRGAALELRSVHWYESEGVAAISRSLLRLYRGE